MCNIFRLQSNIINRTRDRRIVFMVTVIFYTITSLLTPTITSSFIMTITSSLPMTITSSLRTMSLCHY